MVSDGMGARAVDVLLGQIHDSDGPPQQVVMRTLLKVLFMGRLPSHRLLGFFVTRRRLTNLVLSAQPMQNEQHAYPIRFKDIRHYFLRELYIRDEQPGGKYYLLCKGFCNE